MLSLPYCDVNGPEKAFDNHFARVSISGTSVQDDMNARLQASKSNEAVKLEASSNEVNPAGGSTKASESGLAKLDAGQSVDETPIEDKIETVAGAIGVEGEAPSEPPKVSKQL